MKVLKTKCFIRARKDRNAAATSLMTIEGLVQVDILTNYQAAD
jgi:hypothetical protein